MKKIFLFFLTLLALSCSKSEINTLEKGTYRAVLKVQDHNELPFIFEVKNDSTFVIFNADEKIIVDEISYTTDSILIKTPIFEGYIKAKIDNNQLNGFFIKESLDRIVPFSASKNNTRFALKSSKPNTKISGSWETVFSPNSKTERYIAKGIFTQKDEKVTGTFRTITGDYRYLEGIVDGDSLKLSTFDGAHAFLFTAKVTDSTMIGNFYSGNHWKEPFVAKRNENYELPKADSLTYLKAGFDSFDFSFPNERGKMISLSDEKYQNKVVLVQIMGTWCPNCLDESKFYVQYLKENPNPNLAMIGLAFEVAKTKELAFKRINRLKNRIGITYPILLAQIGSTDKKLAQEKLPMLNHVLSYPTTIFIDKKGSVRKIHTGFNGPATGEKYTEFKDDFEIFIKSLLNE